MKTDAEILREYGGRQGARGQGAAPSRKSVQEINAEHGQRAGELLTGVYDRLDDIRDHERLEESSYLRRMNPQERFRLLQAQKREKAEELRRETVERYRAEVEAYHVALESREKELRESLFGGLDAPTLAAAASAADEALPRILEAAVAAGNAELAKAAFVAASSRGLDEVIVRYLETDGEARELYHELKAVPPEEARERQLDSVEQVVPEVDPERLAGSPPVGS